MTEVLRGAGSGSPGDLDGDGLPNDVETEGWDIAIDELGYGPSAPIELLTIRTVFSNPMEADSDGDGLSDLKEYLIGTDPESADTDGDHLADTAEVKKWFTNPNTVDTDADSRGPNGDLVPNGNLFDWLELSPTTPITSPSLADTDGDGRTDFEEIGHPLFDPLIAELPRADFLIAGDLDLRLDVEYSESVGGEVAYEVTLSSEASASQGTGESSSMSTTSGTHLESSGTSSWEKSVEGEAGFEIVPPNFTGSVTGSTSSGGSTTLTLGAFQEVGQESVFTSSADTSKTSGQSHSTYISESNTFTETTATGTITLPFQIINESPFSYTVTNLGMTLLMYEQPDTAGEPGSFKAMGTIVPNLPSVTLAPGEVSSILTLSSGSLNADVVKDFMAAPSTLILQPASFDLVDQNGIDFDFLNENTFTQTALVEVDLGAGDVRKFRVATNVDRDGSTYNGIGLGEVVSRVLGFDYAIQTVTEDGQPVLGTDPEGQQVPIQVLKRLEDKETMVVGGVAAAVWVTFVDGDLSKAVTAPDGAGGEYVSFESIRLFAGDSVRLIYTKDLDGDGLWEAEEKLFGTRDDAADTDGDDMNDREEAVTGWEITDAEGATRQVYSDPRTADTDDDGLDDLAERAAGTDPRHPDTDLDGLADGEDPFPAIPATRFYATLGQFAAAPPWNSTPGSLKTLFENADVLNTDLDPANDVSEIWVLQGVLGAGVTLPQHLFPRGNVKLYGGFHIGDTKLGQRDSDPITNGSVLWGGGIQFRETVPVGILPSGTIDSFTFTNGSLASVHIPDGLVTLRNLLFVNNTTTFGSVLVQELAAKGEYSSVLMENCTFASNQASLTGPFFGALSGGAVSDAGDASVYRDCTFISNTSIGGGAYYRKPSSASSAGPPTFERCLFQSNQSLWATVPANTSQGGGAIRLEADGAHIADCDFVNNRATSLTPDSGFGFGLRALYGGAILWGEGIDASPSGPLSIVNSRFFGNMGAEGSAIFVKGLSTAVARTLSVVNSSFARNFGLLDDTPFSGFEMGGLIQGGPPGLDISTPVYLRNNIFWGNLGNGITDPAIQAGTFADIEAVANLGSYTFNSGPLPQNYDIAFNLIGADFSVIYEALAFSNIGNTDPMFQAMATGNLRLSTGSPAIDTGLSFVDPIPGPTFELLPPTDLDGNPRIVDGDGSGGAQVDMGAYEVQP